MSHTFFWQREEKKKSISHKIIEVCTTAAVGFGFLILMGLACGLQVSEKETKRLKKKLRFFTPTINEGIFGKYTSWTLRDKPLTEEEVEVLWNSKI